MLVVKVFSPQEGILDSWIWAANIGGIYSISSPYVILQGDNQDNSGYIFKYLWEILAPYNAMAFGWKVFHDRIKTRVNLRRRHVIHCGMKRLLLIFCFHVHLRGIVGRLATNG